MSTRADTRGFSLRPLPERAGVAARAASASCASTGSACRAGGCLSTAAATAAGTATSRICRPVTGSSTRRRSTSTRATCSTRPARRGSRRGCGTAWEEPDARPVSLESTCAEQRDRVLLLDCLDPIYGHSLLKLLNVQRELAGDAGVVVLAPSSLRLLVPDGVAELWTVDEPARPVPRLAARARGAARCRARPLRRLRAEPGVPAPPPVDVRPGRRSSTVSSPSGPAAPSIVLSLRDDRPWGEDAAAQAQRGRALAARRRRLPGSRRARRSASARPRCRWVDGPARRGPGEPTRADAGSRSCAAPTSRSASTARTLLLPSGLARAATRAHRRGALRQRLPGTLLAEHRSVRRARARIASSTATRSSPTSRPERVAAVALPSCGRATASRA